MKVHGEGSDDDLIETGVRVGQCKFRFANGYGASVITDGYGSDRGLWELAVLDRSGRITYDTPVTDDVVGWLTEADARSLLRRIADLPEAPKRRRRPL